MNKSLTKKQRFIGALTITLVLYVLFSISSGLYIYTDNITVGVVTSGMYGNNQCQYLHHLLCLVIGLLNPVLPFADVYATLTHVSLLLGIFLISYAFIETAFQKPIRKWRVDDMVSAALMALAIVYFTLGLKLFGVNYTVQTTAIISEGVIALVYGAKTRKRRSWIVAATAVVGAGFLQRYEACLLFLPFLALELLTEIVRAKDKAGWFKNNRRYLLPAIVVIIALLASKAAFMNIEPYKSDAAYNRYRTISEDYPMETYGVTYKDFSEIDHDTYIMVTHWILADTDVINEDTLRKIAEVGSRNDYQYTSQGLKWTLNEMKRVATTQDVHLMVLLALTALLTLWNILTARGVWLKLESVLCTLGGFVILFYFTFRGRAPIRVWQCVVISALTVHVLVMIKGVMDRQSVSPVDRKGQPGGVVIFQLLLCVVLYFGVGQVMAHSSVHAPVFPLTARVGADDSAYEATFEEDVLYLWPNWYSAIPDYFSRQDKLPTQRVIEHNIAFGDWLYGQVYFRDFLSRIGAENPAKALLERSNTYFIEGQEDILLEFMRKHYGDDIQAEYVRKVNGKKAYRLVRKDD